MSGSAGSVEETPLAISPDTIVHIGEAPQGLTDSPRQATVTTGEDGAVQIFMPHGCQITFTPRDSGAVRTLGPSTPTTPSRAGFDTALRPTASSSSLSSHPGSSSHRPASETSVRETATSSEVESAEGSSSSAAMPTAVASTRYMTQRVPGGEDHSHRRPRKVGLGFQDAPAVTRRSPDDEYADNRQPLSCPPSGRPHNFAPTTAHSHENTRRPVSATYGGDGHKSRASGKRPAASPRPASLATLRRQSADPFTAHSQLGSPFVNISPPTTSRDSHHLPPAAPQRILFYHKHDPYYGFTNFSDHPVLFNNKLYPTSEHLFQASKFIDHRPLIAEHIRTVSRRPAVAFSEARRFQPEVRPDWLQSNIEMMDRAISLKFRQHPELRQELLLTGDAELVEDSDKDAFWGVGADGRGRNELGKALMRLRASLRREGSAEALRPGAPPSLPYSEPVARRASQGSDSVRSSHRSGYSAKGSGRQAQSTRLSSASGQSGIYSTWERSSQVEQDGFRRARRSGVGVGGGGGAPASSPMDWMIYAVFTIAALAIGAFK